MASQYIQHALGKQSWLPSCCKAHAWGIANGRSGEFSMRAAPPPPPPPPTPQPRGWMSLSVGEETRAELPSLICHLPLLYSLRGLNMLIDPKHLVYFYTPGTGGFGAGGSRDWTGTEQMAGNQVIPGHLCALCPVQHWEKGFE